MLSNLKIHHIGYAVKSIEDALPFYVKMGFSKTDVRYDPIQNVNICFIQKRDNVLIELIEPKDETSPVNKILSQSGSTPYHICYETECIDVTLKELKNNHFMPISKLSLAPAIGDGKSVIFLFNKNVGLIEIVC